MSPQRRETTLKIKTLNIHHVSFFQLSSYDIVSNLTGRNISDYLMKTTKDFNKRRYGGFEFGVGNPLAGEESIS